MPQDDSPADPAGHNDDFSAVAVQIAASLAQLRGPRPAGPPWAGFGPGGGRARGLRPLHDPRGVDSPRAGSSEAGSNGADASRADPRDSDAREHGAHAHHRDMRRPHGRDDRDTDAGSRGPGGRDHGPVGRFAARLRLLEALAAASTPLSVSEVGGLIGVDQPRASRLVQAAVEAGHVRREADASDARRTRIVLTDEGRAVIGQARGARIGTVERALSGFSADDQAQLAALLARLADAWPRT